MVIERCPQEISDMLANNLTLDEEEAVQEEFKELQALTVSSPAYRHGGISVDTSLDSRGWTEGSYQTPRRSRHGTRPCQDSRYRVILSFCTGNPRLTAHSRTSSGGTGPGADARSRVGYYTIYSCIFFSPIMSNVYLEFCTVRSPSTQRRG